MKSKWIPGILFVMLLLGFLAYLVSSGSALPQRVASHFDFRGQPDSWMSRPNYLLVIGLIGAGLPALIAGLFFITRFFPPRLINLPQREYWLAPERRAQTFDSLFRQGLWLGCLMLLFMGSIHYLVVQANSRTPVALSSSIALFVGLYLLGMAVWMVVFFRHFCKRGLAPANDASLPDKERKS